MTDIIIVTENRDDLGDCWECEFDYTYTSGGDDTHTLYINDQVEEEDLEETGRDWFRHHWTGDPLKSIALGSYSFEADDDDDDLGDDPWPALKSILSLDTMQKLIDKPEGFATYIKKGKSTRTDALHSNQDIQDADAEIAAIYRDLEDAMNESGVNVVNGPQGWYTDPPLFLDYHYFPTRGQAIMHHVIRFVRGM